MNSSTQFRPSSYSHGRANPSASPSSEDRTGTSIKMLAGGLILLVGLVAVVAVKPNK